MTSSPEVARRGSGFEAADTRAAPRVPRTFIATPAAGGDSTPRPFRGVQLPPGADSEATVKVREAARAGGYAAGWAQGLRQAAERAEAELVQDRQARQDAARTQEALRRAARDRAEDALHQAAQALRSERTPTVGELADTVLELALDLAGAVLDREVTLMASPVGAAVARALRPLDDELPVTVRVHPDDLITLTGDGLKGETPRADAGRVTYLPDPSLSPGDAVARQGDTDVDASLRAAVARALQALTGGGPVAGEAA